MKYLTIALTLTFSSIALSDPITLTNLYIEGTHKHTKPYSGLFVAANNQLYDVSQFYKHSGLLLHGQFVLSKRLNNFGKFYIPVFFDVGYSSTLYSVEPFLSTGVLFEIDWSDNQSIIIGASNVVQIGGNISEHPCIDQFSRDFHCGTGLPWGDRPILETSLPSIVSLKLIGRF